MKILILLLFITTVSFGQEKTLLEDGKIKHSKPNTKMYTPLGKDVTLSYDEFFKTYTVTYTNVDGYKNVMKFKYDDIGDIFSGNWTYNGKRFTVVKNEAHGEPPYRIEANYQIIGDGTGNMEKYMIYDFKERN